eukprot:GFUD01022476.1.p1 GENE.GFUD01022476.1~~GFUD01022476.1.p1  ORF type:complete len:461 (-),score=147.82 GFUD01022476.1:186-1568(-)
MGVQCFKFLAKELPGFRVHGSQIKIIHEPKHFYQELVNRSLTSQHRIVLSALYLGTEEKEKRLVEAVGSSLERHGNLRVKVLLDWCRGTRVVNGESSASLLAQLKNKACERCRVSFYHTPHLRGWLKRLLPSKWNETVGLQHCKVYVFDDSLIISGANLSRDYFTARQDRYLVVENCPALADYYEGLVDTVASFSLVLDREGEFRTEKGLRSHPYKGRLSDFVEESSGLVNNFLEDQKVKNKVDLEDFDTVVFPTVQMGQLGIRQDSQITSRILRSGGPGGIFHFATGYFNLTTDYMGDMVDSDQSQYSLLMAHPQANGFLGARGPAGGIPHAYTLIAQNFWNLILSKDLQNRIKMYEYKREDWTFHAKGMWYSPSMSLSKMPCLTMVGSPNFGYRSVSKDLETQVTILTTNKELQEKMGEEQSLLYNLGKEVDSNTFQQEERRVPAWVKMVVGLTRKFF